ncbi:MAG: hypothetical protein JW839_03735 [Candidatus Lokiarchaeota archaeon]|nr:hypothetical protein [Candidatus Lokiarchaeota archaeon]
MNERGTKRNLKSPAVRARGFELRRGYLYESIVGVLDAEGNPHLAPLGVRVTDKHDDGKLVLEARVFTTATTYPRLKRGGECTVHFPGRSQLGLFFLPFRDVLPGLQEGVAPPGMIGRGRSVATPVHLGIANYLEAGVTWVEDEEVNDAIAAQGAAGSRRGVFRLSSRVVVVNDPGSSPITRQDGLILEFLVKASRFRCCPPGSHLQRATVSELAGIIEKMDNVAPGDDKTALALRVLESFLRELNGS